MLDYVLIELGGKTRKLKYDFNAVSDVEAQLRVGLPALLMGERVGFNSLRWLVWGGLKHAHKNLMPWKVGEWLQQYMTDGGTLKELTDLVMQALTLGKVLTDDEPVTEDDADSDNEEEGEEGNE